MLGLTAGFLILIFIPEPKRGCADQLTGRIKTRSSWLCDMKALAKKYATFFSYPSLKNEMNLMFRIGMYQMQPLNQPLSEYWTLSVYFYSHAFT